jgi:hypothetical protein
MVISVDHRGSPAWERAAGVVRSRYKEAFNADVLPSPEYFVSLCRRPGPGAPEPAILACVGMTSSPAQRFFSERYLDEPAEQAIEAHAGMACRRDGVAEIGSLASVSSEAGAALIRLLPIVTWCHGKRFVLVTATRRLNGLLRLMGIEFHALKLSSVDRLHDEDQRRWGSYYAAAPSTGYINVAAALASPDCHSFDDLGVGAARTGGGVRALS